MFIFERERQCVSRGGAESEGDRIWNRIQAQSCQHRAQHGLELTGREIVTCAEVGGLTHWGNYFSLLTFMTKMSQLCFVLWFLFTFSFRMWILPDFIRNSPDEIVKRLHIRRTLNISEQNVTTCNWMTNICKGDRPCDRGIEIKSLKTWKTLSFFFDV